MTGNHKPAADNAAYSGPCTPLVNKEPLNLSWEDKDLASCMRYKFKRQFWMKHFLAVLSTELLVWNLQQ